MHAADLHVLFKSVQAPPGRSPAAASGIGADDPVRRVHPGYGPPSLNGTGIGDLMFEEGMVFGNNIDLSNPKWKPDVGCMFGDMVVVRENCAERLVDIPLFLPEVG